MIRCTRVWTPAFARQCLLLLTIILLPGVATAQVDYSAGKTGEQLFNSDCSACHASPQVVGRGRDVRALTNFLGQHYTTKTQWAALIANYIVRARDNPPPAPAPAATPALAPAPEQPAKPSNEREVKAAPETLKSKLRSYATAGEEARAPTGPSKD
jgi:mono/diheme cytochrome c family protein